MKISNLKLDIAIYAGNKQNNKDCSKVLNSSAMLEKSSMVDSLDWNYIVLEDLSEYLRSQLEREDIS